MRNSLVKYGFIKILELEFGIYLKEHETEKIELAETCIEVYVLFGKLNTASSVTLK